MFKKKKGKKKKEAELEPEVRGFLQWHSGGGEFVRRYLVVNKETFTCYNADPVSDAMAAGSGMSLAYAMDLRKGALPRPLQAPFAPPPPAARCCERATRHAVAPAPCAQCLRPPPHCCAARALVRDRVRRG